MAFIEDGYQTIIALNSLVVPVTFKEREVQPFGLDGGGEIDTTTMRNLVVRTKNPKALVSLDDMTCQVNYDPAQLLNILAAVNINTLISTALPDATVWSAWGWIDKFVPAALKEGEFPMAELKIHFSNHDNNGVEVLPTVS